MLHSRLCEKLGCLKHSLPEKTMCALIKGSMSDSAASVTGCRHECSSVSGWWACQSLGHRTALHITSIKHENSRRIKTWRKSVKKKARQCNASTYETNKRSICILQLAIV